MPPETDVQPQDPSNAAEPSPSEQLQATVDGSKAAAGQGDGGKQPDAQVGVESDGKQAADEGDSGKSGADAKPAPDAPRDWRQARIDKQSQKIRDLTTQLAKFQGQQQGQREPDQDFEARVNAEAEKRAQALQRNSSFQRESLAAQAKGEEAFGKEAFNRSVMALRGLRDDNDQESVAAHLGLIRAALATGEAPKLVHMLGQDLNEASRIMGLEPVQQGIALARLAAKDAPQTSAAPPPIEPLGAKGKSRVEIRADDKDRSDDLSTATFMERRNADIKAGKSRARA